MLMVMLSEIAGCFLCAENPKGPPQGAQADRPTPALAGFCEHDLTHVDIAGQESGLAIREEVFPQPPEAIVEAERSKGRPSLTEVILPGRERLGIILPKNAFADHGHTERVAERLQDL